MKKYLKYILLSLFCLIKVISFAQYTDEEFPAVEIKWVDDLPGDFSFVNNWEFPLGVETKADGKAGCADGGFCPERCYGMLDSDGIVLKDSADIFYQLLDTTHIHYSIQCEARCYEFAGTNEMIVIQSDKHNFHCYTTTGIATHCSLNLDLNHDICYPYIYLNSITDEGETFFYYKSGFIKIDKNFLEKGILKAEFDFTFANPSDTHEPVYWKGKIYATIEH